MEVQYGPNAIDEPDLLYKLQRKIKVFNTSSSLPNRGYNIVASCSKYGLVFVLAPNSILSAYYLKDLIDKECEPQHVALKLQTEPTHIAVNCDQEWLAVISKTMLFVYKILDFQNPNASPSFSIKLDINPATFVSAVQWNPCIPDTIAIAFFDGTLLVSQVTTMQVKKMQSNVRCICWSPKGKQLVTGNSDGTLCQYKPDLSPMKMVPAPNLFEGAPIEVLAIHWIATYQFLVVFKHATDNVRPAVTIVNTPKGGQPSCINFEDICYSLGSNRPWYYYLYGLMQWNMILASSSNSSEIATLSAPDGCNWKQWCQIDEARPELPLTDGNQDNYPVGLCVDNCAIHQLPWGENETLPPMPLLLVLSQTGMLSIFNIINLKKDAPMFCIPPQQITLPATVMTSSIPDDVPQSVTVTSSAPISQPQPQPVQVEAPTIQPPEVTQPMQSFASYTLMQQQLMQQVQALPGLFPAPTPAPAAATPQIPEIKPIETKLQPPPPQNIVTSTPKPPKVEVPEVQSPIQQQQEMNAALKSEQERVNKLKVNEELMNMLIREVNDFQMELYKFQVKTREAHIKLQQEIETMGSGINMKSQDITQLQKDSAIEEIRETIIMLKLDLVRVCAAVAEARTHAETRQMQEWSQADPLTMKRVAAVKKLAYYVQTQLDQAHRALDIKWSEVSTKTQYERPGERMLRPILDDIYQPLVKQQEILSRQQAVLKALRNTLKECGDVAPSMKTSILRSTPFRNKADPISKMTKGINNMSLEPENHKYIEQTMSNQKLDALRDMLSNHKTVKIKPVNIELAEKMMEMRIKYENSVKERKAMLEKQQRQQILEKQKAESLQLKDVKPDVSVNRETGTKSESKNEAALPSVLNVPSYKPFSNAHYKPGMASVTRTLFTDEPKLESAKFQVNQPKPKPLPGQMDPNQEQTNPLNTMPITSTTLSLLKDMLQSKSQAKNDAKNDANTFMGQAICSPTDFSSSTLEANMAEIDKMRSKLQSKTASKPKVFTNIKSSETGEAESNTNKPIAEKTVPNAFSLKSTAPLTAAKVLNVPDIVKTSNQTAKVEAKKEEVKDKEKTMTKVKENVPGKENKALSEPQKLIDAKKDESKFNLSNNARAVFSLPSSLQISKVQTVTTQATSVTQSPITTSTSTKEPTQQKPEPVATPLSSSIFGTAYTAQKQQNSDKPTSPTGSIFATKSTTNIFGTSLFGTATTTSSTAKSIFGSAVLSTTFPTSTSVAVTESKTTTETSKVEAPAQIISTTTSTEPTTTKTQAVVSTNTTVTAPKEASVPTPVTTSSVIASASTTTPSVLSTTTTTTSAPTTTQQSIFGGAASSSVFGKSTPFGSTTQTSQSSEASTTSQSSIFGTSTVTTQASMFGTATSQASIFASNTSTTQASIFGTTASTQGSIFGNSTATTQASVFETPTTTTQASVFGTPTTTSQASVFGTPTTTQATVFGTPTPTTQDSVFSSPTTTTTTQASVFGTPTTTQASVFGTPTATTQASIFGTPTTQASIFGTPTTTQGSIFGTPTTTQSTSLFGGGEGNLFAAATISTTNASTPASGGNIFGGSSGSIFSGGNTNVFGGKTTFGQSNQAASIFGAANASLKQDSTSNNFWGGGNTTGSAFGSTGFGNFRAGQQATTQASIFGSSGGSFSTPAGGQPLGSPQQSAFGGETKSVFGTPQQQTAPAFGGSPVFGSKPVFGQSASFGSSASFGGFGGLNKSPTAGGFGAPATFGGAPAFGAPAFGGTSPGKLFGGAAATPGFGSPTQSNSTFETLASQNTLTFGNLAQQSAQQNQPQPSFNTSPSFTGWRG